MRIKLYILAILAIATTALLPAVQVYAGDDPYKAVCDSRTQGSFVCQNDGQDPITGEEGVILKVVNILSWIIGVTSVIMIIIAGLKFITANGDSNSVAGARNTVIYALIGVAVLLSTRIIVSFVISKL